LKHSPGVVDQRVLKDDDFFYEIRNNSAVFKKYEGLVNVYKKNAKKLKVFLPEDYFDMAEEVEYLEKIREIYQEVYDI
jgi:hypothetical protein